MYCISASYMYHKTKYVPVWLETSYNIYFKICIHRLQIAQDIIWKLSNGVIKSQISIHEGIMSYYSYILLYFHYRFSRHYKSSKTIMWPSNSTGSTNLSLDWTTPNIIQIPNTTFFCFQARKKPPLTQSGLLESPLI